jgi:nucleoside-diphosphate-sugar epimerase
MKKAAVCGGSGFLGSWMCDRLRKEGYWVTSYDIKQPEFGWAPANEYYIFDLRNGTDYFANFRWHEYNTVVQMAASMGGAEFVFSGENDAEIMRSSALINLNVLEACRQFKVANMLFTSSACVYPTLPNGRADCREDDITDPDSAYGHEKLFSEHLYKSYAKNHGMNIKIARVHNAYGEYGTWRGGKEKSPAAFCRKIAEAGDGGTIECFGTGEQTRSFIHASEAIEGFWRLLNSDVVAQPINVGSSEMVSINQMIALLSDISGNKVDVKHIPGPLGVAGRNSNNDTIFGKLGWKPTGTLREGLEKTYPWIKEQVDRTKTNQ